MFKVRIFEGKIEVNGHELQGVEAFHIVSNGGKLTLTLQALSYDVEMDNEAHEVNLRTDMRVPPR